MRRITAGLVAAFALLLTAAAGTASAAAPAATTGGANKISSSDATLNGKVDPNGERTTWYYEFGTTRRYGSRTPDKVTGRGTSPINARAAIGGLAPDTTYHFRLVASNPSGVVSGQNRTFKTRKQPLGLGIIASGNPIVFGEPAVIAGTLTGTENAGRQVVLQARGFPYTSSFQQIGNPIVTAPNGSFSFTLLPQTANTQYRVQTVATPRVTSPVLNLSVAVKVGTRTTATRVKRRKRVRFSGTITPARAGAQYAIQRESRKTPGQWDNVAGGITRGSGDQSTFSKKVRIRRSGNYRVFVSIIDGNLVSGIGRTVAVRVIRR